MYDFAEKKIVLRLSDNKANTRAFVEVFNGVGSWGRACTHTWTLVEAEIVCQHMGYQRALGALRLPSSDPSKRKLTSFAFKCRYSNSVTRCFHAFIPEQCACETVDTGVICSNG